MKRKWLGNLILTIVVGFSTFAQPLETLANHRVAIVRSASDLRISEFVFAPTNRKMVRVHIVNIGGVVSPLCVLRLTVRKINGIPAGRITEIKLPPLAAGKDKWLMINADRILPKDVSLESTTFKLNADATSIVAELDEANNEVWHNL
jgi:hypothetical protein